MKYGTRPSRTYMPAKIKMPDLASLIDAQSMNLLPFREWQPMPEWEHDLASCPTGDRHWLNTCRHHGFDRAIQSVRMFASMPGFHQSKHVRTFWAIYSGGANLPGSKLFCRPDPDPTPAERQAMRDEVQKLWDGLEVETFPCTFRTTARESGDCEYVSYPHLLHTFRSRYEAIKFYPAPMPAECFAFIRLLCASHIQYATPTS